MSTMMMAALDVAVLGASGGAMLYCAQLSRRLGALKQAEGGTAKALDGLTAATKASQAAAAAMADSAALASARLGAAHADLDAKRQAAEDLSGLLDGQSALATRRLTEATAAADAADASLAAAKAGARIELDALTKAIEIVARVSAVTAPPTDKIAAKPGEPAQALQRASDQPNPFLRAVG